MIDKTPKSPLAEDLRADAELNPLLLRYASGQMSAIFSEKTRAITYRKLWLALARAEMEAGLPQVSPSQLSAMEENLEKIDFERIRTLEHDTRHDVMAHLRAFLEQLPQGSQVHLGATSVFVKDNADLIQMRDALRLLELKTAAVLKALSDFCLKHASLPALSYTHLQPAQPTTLGKRASLWAFELSMDLEALKTEVNTLKLRGLKGTTGTQASFKALFSSDYDKMKALESRVCELLGFEGALSVSAQTYSRKIDARIGFTLASLAQSAHKFTNDLRFLQFLGEVEEPFEREQVGSSAMPYKRNPILAERLSSLSKFLINASQSLPWVSATQWLERTMDDSALRRITLPQMFLAADALLNLFLHLVSGMIVYPKVIGKNLKEALPFMVSEGVLMHAVKRGEERNTAHARIREHALAASKGLKEGLPNDLWERMSADPALHLGPEDLSKLSDPSALTGFAEEQTKSYVEESLNPLLSPYLPAIQVLSFPSIGL